MCCEWGHPAHRYQCLKFEIDWEHASYWSFFSKQQCAAKYKLFVFQNFIKYIKTNLSSVVFFYWTRSKFGFTINLYWHFGLFNIIVLLLWVRSICFANLENEKEKKENKIRTSTNLTLFLQSRKMSSLPYLYRLS